MTKRKTALLRGIVMAGLAVSCFAKTPKLTGKIVAYDPIVHGAKSATYGSNREAIVLEIPGQKTKYVKVVFIGFGTTQIDEKYFDGSTPLTVHALRDKTCDDSSAKFVSQVSLDQKAGTYLLTNPYKNSPPGKIRNLECYDATEKK